MLNHPSFMPGDLLPHNPQNLSRATRAAPLPTLVVRSGGHAGNNF